MKIKEVNQEHKIATNDKDPRGFSCVRNFWGVQSKITKLRKMPNWINLN